MMNHATTDGLFLRQQDGEFIDPLTSQQLRQAMLGRRPFDPPCQAIAEAGVNLSLLHPPANKQLPISAVIMAGGFGTRLRPLTDRIPKPLLPIRERPLMEWMVEQMRQLGIQQFYVTTHYMPEKIMEHFGDGQDFGIKITYVHEETPLGTAGALGLIEDLSQPLLVINGDILTTLDFRAMWAFHCQYKAALTMGVRQYEYQVPYGVIDADGPYVRQMKEKPLHQILINAGVYLLQPSVLRYIPKGQRFDMTDLLDTLLNKGDPVVNFPIIEYWIDIGQPADYAKAQKDFQNW